MVKVLDAFFDLNGNYLYDSSGTIALNANLDMNGDDIGEIDRISGTDGYIDFNNAGDDIILSPTNDVLMDVDVEMDGNDVTGFGGLYTTTGNVNAISVNNNSASYPTIWGENNGDSNCIYGENTSNNYATIYATTNGAAPGLYTNGDIDCDGTKHAIIKIGENGDKDIRVKMSTIETGRVWLEHIESGESNKLIKFHPTFEKVISKTDYKVFITPTSEPENWYVKKQPNGFTVISNKSFTFDYRITALRKDTIDSDYEIVEIEKSDIMVTRMKNKFEEDKKKMEEEKLEKINKIKLKRDKIEKITLADNTKAVIINQRVFTKEGLLRRKEIIVERLARFDEALKEFD